MTVPAHSGDRMFGNDCSLGPLECEARHETRFQIQFWLSFSGVIVDQFVLFRGIMMNYVNSTWNAFVSLLLVTVVRVYKTGRSCCFDPGFQISRMAACSAQVSLQLYIKIAIYCPSPPCMIQSQSSLGMPMRN